MLVGWFEVKVNTLWHDLSHWTWCGFTHMCMGVHYSLKRAISHPRPQSAICFGVIFSRAKALTCTVLVPYHICGRSPAEIHQFVSRIFLTQSATVPSASLAPGLCSSFSGDVSRTVRSVSMSCVLLETAKIPSQLTFQFYLFLKLIFID